MDNGSDTLLDCNDGLVFLQEDIYRGFRKPFNVLVVWKCRMT
jgi:hypothetical protein